MIQHVDGYGRKYNPDRDIVHLYQKLAGAAFHSLARDNWGPIMREFARFSGAEDKDLVAAAEALAKFVAVCKNPKHTTFQDAWSAAGFDAVPPAAVVAVMWRIGVEATGAFHHGAREAFEMYRNAPGTDFLQETAERVAHLAGRLPSVQDRLAGDMRQFLARSEHDAKVGKT
jgi:hypothetical protein